MGIYAFSQIALFFKSLEKKTPEKYNSYALSTSGPHIVHKCEAAHSVFLLALVHIQGVLKKRQNFLNSAPTNTECVLGLLSAPSVGFLQQTAICSVLL